MPENKAFPPEGLRPSIVCTMQSLKQAAESGEILEAVALRCDVNHTLHFSLNGIRAIMEREEVNAEVGACGCDFTHRHDALLVSHASVESACFCPSSVAVHDDGNVLREV